MKKLRLADFLPYQLSFTSNLVSEAIASEYQAVFGLGIPEWRVLAVIAEHAPVTQLKIRQITLMDKVTVSRAAAALEAKRLTDRVPNEEDRRSHLLRLTAKGQELYQRIVPLALEIEAQLFASLSSDEAKQLGIILRRIDTHVLQMSRSTG